MTFEEAHRLAREQGVSRPLYALVRAALVPFMRLYFRMHISGAEDIPAEGAAIVNASGLGPSLDRGPVAGDAAACLRCRRGSARHHPAP